jgi:hypothetical protein
MRMAADHVSAEYRTLRDTIRERGSQRVTLFWATIAVWAALLTATALAGARPLVTLIPLVLLAAGFEAIVALHVGVERVGRYLQVFYEEEEPGTLPAWERSAMAYGRSGTGVRLDALFTGVFCAAALLNVAPSLLAPRPIPTAIILLAHLVFGARLLRAHRAAARQRQEDLQTFRTMKEEQTGR